MTSAATVVIFMAAAFGVLNPRIAAAQSYSPRMPQPGQALRWVTVDGQTG